MRNTIRQLFQILLIMLVLWPSIAAADQVDDLAFPVYRIDMAPNDLAALEADPWSDTTYPAAFSYDGRVIPCEVRYRGATSRKHPKKSWKVEFQDDDNPLHVEELNLNAEYIDQSFLRNYLANKLFSHVGIPAPSCSFVNLAVNGTHMGLFLSIEQIDDLFFERYGRNPGNLYKALMHAANMAPLAHDSDYISVWDPKNGTPADFDGLREFFSKAYYWTDSDFEAHIGEVINVDEFIRYFAVLFCIASNDNYCKNQFLHENPDTGTYELLPWDNDATFGISWEGDYYSSYETFVYGTTLDYNTVFRRLMGVGQWHDQFWNEVRQITTEGFGYLSSCIDTILPQLQHDAFLDTCKAGENEDFPQAVAMVRQFMTHRCAAMATADGFHRVPMYDMELDPPLLRPDQQTYTIRVTSLPGRTISCCYTKDLNMSLYGGRHTPITQRMYDDGAHGDGVAGDGVYGVELILHSELRGHIPVTFQTGNLYYPWNGFLYVNLVRNHMLVINAMNDSSDALERLSILTCYESQGVQAVEIRNTSTEPVDLSFSYLRCGEYFNRIQFPEETALEPGQRLLVTTDIVTAAHLFPDDLILENECPLFAVGDTLAILAPDMSVVTSRTCPSFQDVPVEVDNIVINEINYHSASSHDTEDWIEIYNAGSTMVDLTGWVVCDCDDSHRFTFPSSATIGPHEYMVIARDADKFTSCFPNVTPVGEDMDFGLDASGETVRLFDSRMILVDMVTYDDRDPWPVEPDGYGATLSLLNPRLDNALAEHWAASIENGTPGRKNDVFTGIGDEQPGIIRGDGLASAGNYPNPFNMSTVIPFSLACEAVVRIDVYSVSGQHVATVLDKRFDPGDHTVRFTGDGIPSGVYLYRIHTQSSEISGRMVLMK